MGLNRPVRVVFGTPADEELTNAQCLNGREIGSRLPPSFQLTYFHLADPDPRLVARRGTRFVRLGAHANALRLVREVLAGHDVYFNINCGPAESLLRPLLRLTSKPATVFQVETHLPVPKWLGAPDRFLRGMNAWIEEATAVTGVSHAVVRHLKERLGRSDAVRIPVGVNVAAATEPRRDRPRPVVLTVGSLKPGKRPHLVTEAATRFPGADFRLVGDGPLRGSIEAAIASSGINNVELIRSLPNRDVIMSMSQADVFFFPSVHEGQPRVVLEAAASALPVVCRNDYSPEGVLPGISGFAVATDDEMFGALESLLASQSLRKQMGEAGKAHAAGFDWSRIVPAWAELFERLSA